MFWHKISAVKQSVTIIILESTIERTLRQVFFLPTPGGWILPTSIAGILLLWALPIVRVMFRIIAELKTARGKVREFHIAIKFINL